MGESDIGVMVLRALGVVLLAFACTQSAVAKEGIVWATVPMTNTWTDNTKLCAKKGLDLCTKAQLCPGGKPAAKAKMVEWTAIKDANQWVKTKCEDHPGGLPGWGEKKGYVQWRNPKVACCTAHAPGAISKRNKFKLATEQAAAAAAAEQEKHGIRQETLREEARQAIAEREAAATAAAKKALEVESAVAKEGMVWATVPMTNTGTDNTKLCAKKGLDLCTKAQLCPGGKPAAKAKMVEWTAIKDANQWVKITCEDHPGGRPYWGEKKGHVRWRNPKVACCTAAAPTNAPTNAPHEVCPKGTGRQGQEKLKNEVSKMDESGCWPITWIKTSTNRRKFHSCHKASDCQTSKEAVLVNAGE